MPATSKFQCGVIQTNFNNYERRLLDVTWVDDETANLDACPAGTMDIYTFETAKKAAKWLGVSISTVYRRAAELRQAQEEDCD